MGQANMRVYMKRVAFASFFLFGLLLVVRIPTAFLAPFYTNVGFVVLDRTLHPDAIQGRDAMNAENWFQKAIAQDLQSVQAHRGLGRSYVFQERYVEAIPVLERAAVIRPGDAFVHLALGDAYDGIGDRDNAIREWRIAGAESILLHRGLAQEQRRDWEEAAYWYLAAVEVDPNWAAAYYHLGLIRRVQGMAAEAIYYLQCAASLTPDDPFVHHQLGLNYMDQEKAAQAIQEFEQVLQLKPDDRWTTIYLASLYLGQDDLDKAMYYAQRASGQSRHPRPHFVLGMVYHKRGLLEKAIIELSEAVRLVPIWNQTSPHHVGAKEVIKYQLALAEAYEDTGQIPKAAAAYRAILDLDPAHRQALEALQRLGQK